MGNTIRHWLTQVPVNDPVDHRNAPFVQLLMMFIGTFVPLNKVLFLYATLSRHATPPAWLAVDLTTDALIVAAAWTGVWLIRQGRFRQGVTLFLGVLLLCLGAAYASAGMDNLGLDPIPLLLLAIAGLVMGRRALWITLAVLLSILAACLLLDVLRATQRDGAAPAAMAGKLVSMTIVYLLVAILLDRTVAALRASLEESNARGRELELANERLRHEIVQRERAREQLIHAQKVEATGRLASGVAHDFDNILSVVLGHAARRERIADRGPQALLDALEDVELAARRALAINRKLLNLSRQEVSRPEVFDALQALRDMLPMLRQLFAADIRVRLEGDAGPLPILLDRGRFELMLLNIAANARDAMPDGGDFRILAQRAADAQHLELALSDSGVGMPEAVRERIFDAFFTTKPSGSGTGLGLSMVRDMVIEAGGGIHAESVPGQGSTLRIVLPLAADPA
ncbi:sensor histidine kinase [Pseudoxanthomonas putridarboris]|uniref:histidine kinase n=1 Tax=Pseudoxanthomonas putridarboris TaxID=752605 RepID=A0ABU9J5C9_9GAMM